MSLEVWKHLENGVGDVTQMYQACIFTCEPAYGMELSEGATGGLPKGNQI